MEVVTIQKGQVLQEAGVRKVHAYQVIKGLLRSYFIDKMGKEHTFLFAPEGWVIADLYASGFDKESQLKGDQLANSDNRFKMMHRRAGAMQQRVLMMMSTSALERYEYFLETYPELAERISQKLIASYLGITPQALSKLRRDRVMPDRS
jgi:CRP-like cAMP-binding protein